MNVRQEEASRYWFARHSKSIIFLVIVLAAVGIYEALSIPLSVFPATDFPRILISVDNGVMPIDQMEVTITRPIEEAMNSVPGLTDVRSTTSRGSWKACGFSSVGGATCLVVVPGHAGLRPRPSWRPGWLAATR